MKDIRPKKSGLPVGPRLISKGEAPTTKYEGTLETFKNPAATTSTVASMAEAVAAKVGLQ